MVEAWYQCTTQYQHAATICATEADPGEIEPVHLWSQTWMEGSFSFRVASVCNAPVVLVSGTASPSLETGPETSRHRWAHNNKVLHEDQIIRVRRYGRPDHSPSVRAASFPVPARACCTAHGVGATVVVYPAYVAFSLFGLLCGMSFGFPQYMFFRSVERVEERSLLRANVGICVVHSRRERWRYARAAQGKGYASVWRGVSIVLESVRSEHTTS
ncbi:hypothetical protein OPT61_g10657 [Boeremia exigua]|uniref:Uncharacterized protein n=1 Tax=Boeremia exigua TaxID=749465 RepID=A0ACC2HQ28_9PLEO|nr:hypothetical protein OPT61_g10657 [Boeremia exigua]